VSRVALVTGGAVRLGRATVTELAAAGWSVAFTYRTSAREAAALVRRLRNAGTDCLAIKVDLVSPAAPRRIVARIEHRFGRLDALVNNAAIFPRTPFADLDAAALRTALRVNLEAPVLLAHACAPLLRAARGAIVNLVDIHAAYPLRHYLPYCVSKGALAAATRALAVELAPEVRVNAVAPGIAQWPDEYQPEIKRRLVARTLLRRPGSAAEIARAIRFLLEGTDTTTGQVLTIDAGRTVTV
jgi:pteridine reductase